MNKKCSKCKDVKSIDEFHKKKASKDSYKSICKKCTSEYKKKYRKENADKIRNYRKKNKDKIREQHREYTRERVKNDPLFKIGRNVSTMIRNGFRRNGFSKLGNSQEIIGCSFNEFKIHIESKFDEWMNWENYGLYNGEINYGWDVDHINPMCSANTIEEILKLNHYTNLQPLCSKNNRDIKKGRV